MAWKTTSQDSHLNIPVKSFRSSPQKNYSGWTLDTWRSLFLDGGITVTLTGLCKFFLWQLIRVCCSTQFRSFSSSKPKQLLPSSCIQKGHHIDRCAQFLNCTRACMADPLVLVLCQGYPQITVVQLAFETLWMDRYISWNYLGMEASTVWIFFID